jgi:arylsulfatase A-like enzyme
MADRGKRPNILLVVSDQERQRDWLPASVRLPWRERLMAEGLEFTN